MTFPNGLAPDAQNDTDVTLAQKCVQLTYELCVADGNSALAPDPQDSVFQSLYKLNQNLFSYAQ